MPIVFTELSANTNLDQYVKSPNSPFDPKDRYDLIDPRQMIDDLNIRSDRTFSSQKIDEYLTSVDLSNYYNKSAIDAFFSGESSGKKLIDWSKILNKSGADFTYTHNQSVPSASWVINHNLGYFPGGISVIDSADEEVIGNIQQVSVNQLQISFSSAFSGIAYLS